MQFLQRLSVAAAGRTLIMVTHRPAVLELVTRLVVVDSGRIMLDGPKPQVLAALSGQPLKQAVPQTQPVPAAA
jgi:ATP-binding cassette subfamily C protein LapB